MARVLVVYYSRSGNTELMATRISDALSEEGLEVSCKKVEDADVDELLSVEGVVVGSPTYCGTMAAEVKKFLDESVRHHTKLDGKVGAAFATAGSTGQETTVLSILEGFLTHGMIVQGDCRGLHYGVTSVGSPKESDVQDCRRFARRYAALLTRVYSSSA